MIFRLFSTQFMGNSFAMISLTIIQDLDPLLWYDGPRQISSSNTLIAYGSTNKWFRSRINEQYDKKGIRDRCRSAEMYGAPILSYFAIFIPIQMRSGKRLSVCKIHFQSINDSERIRKT